MKKTNPTKPRSEIAAEYGIHRNTLCRQLKNKGITLPKGILYPEDVKRVYEALGYPEKSQQTEDEE